MVPAMKTLAKLGIGAAAALGLGIGLDFFVGNYYIKHPAKLTKFVKEYIEACCEENSPGCTSHKNDCLGEDVYRFDGDYREIPFFQKPKLGEKILADFGKTYTLVCAPFFSESFFLYDKGNKGSVDAAIVARKKITDKERKEIATKIPCLYPHNLDKLLKKFPNLQIEIEHSPIEKNRAEFLDHEYEADMLETEVSEMLYNPKH